MYTRNRRGKKDENRETVYGCDPTQLAFRSAVLSFLPAFFAARSHLEPATHHHAASAHIPQFQLEEREIFSERGPKCIL